MALVGCAGTPTRSTLGGEKQSLAEAIDQADGNIFAIDALHVTLPIDEQKRRIDRLSEFPLPLREWAKSTLEALHTRNGALLVEQLDVDAAAVRGVPNGVPRGARGLLGVALRPAVHEWVKQIVKLDGAVTFRGFVSREEGLVARYRLTGEGGYFYAHFLFPESATKPVDIYFATLGHYMSEAIAHGAQLGMDAQASGHLEALSHMNAKVGSPADYLKAYDALPASLRNSWLLEIKAVWMGQSLGDEAYVQRMQDFLKRFPNHPAIPLVSVDWYFMNEDFQKAMEAAIASEQQVGGDAWLLSLAAMCAYGNDDMARSRSLMAQAESLEPDAPFVASFREILQF